MRTDLQHLSTRGDDAKLCVSCRRREDQLSGGNGKLQFREENWRGKKSGEWRGGKGEVLRGSAVVRIGTAVDRRPADGGKWMVSIEPLR